MLEDGKPKYCILINDFNFQYKLHINYLRNVLLACSKRVIFSKKCKFQFLKSLLDDSFIFQHILSAGFNIPGLTKESRKCSSSVYWYDCTLELHLRDWKDIPQAIHVSLSKIHVILYLVSKASKCKSFTQIMHKLECCSKPSLIILNS